MRQYTADDELSQTRFTPERAAAWQRRAIRADFAAQTVTRQRDTLDRILGLLVEEYRRGHTARSALWRSMDVWGFTPHLVELEATRGER